MNIIIVTHAFNEMPETLFPRYNLIQFANELSKYEDITIISSKLGKSKTIEKINPKLRVIRFKPTIYFPSLPYVLDIFQFLKIYRLYKKTNQFSVIIGYGLQFFCCFSSALAAKLIGLPFICRIVGESSTTMKKILNSLARLYDLIFAKITLKIADKIFVQSRNMRYRPLKLGAPLHKIAIIPDGVNLKRFNKEIDTNYLKKELKIKENQTVLTFASRLCKIKGIEDLITTAKTFVKKYNNILFLIAGTGPLEEKLKEETKEIKDIKILGYREDIPAILASSDIFIHPSYSEGLSPAVMEACASGLPVITTNIGSNPDLIKNGVNGFLIRPGDIKNMKRCLSKLVEDKDLRIKMGKINRKMILENFDIEKTAIKYLKEIHNLTKKHRT